MASPNLITISRNGRSLDCAIASISLPGEEISGDLHVTLETEQGALVGVIDGLGHGVEAARASEYALSVLKYYRNDSLFSLIKKCHEELRRTRGIVLALASMNFKEDTMTWVSVGNVEGILVRMNSNDQPNIERVLQRGGVVGFKLPPIHASMISIVPGDILVLASDGVKPQFVGDIKRKEPVDKIAEEIGERYRRGTDDAIVLAGKYR
ncbi:MAG TPA: SpoIIE family protein phosphatase [Bacteroidota bacterium]|nr:SpoIIE family protein phosphatase [Bacteroidota bacterium]